jgi:hypothetical protein
MQSVYNEGPKGYTAGEALVANRRVKIEGGTTKVPPEVVYADSGEACIGFTLGAAAAGDIVTVRPINDNGTFYAEAAEAFAVNATLYGATNGKVQGTSSGTAYFLALEAAGDDGDVVEIMPFPVTATTAATVSITDTGDFTDVEDTEAALAEIYQDAQSTLAQIDIPTPYFSAAGVALAAFSNGTSDVPGFCVTAKGMGVRWNNDAAPLAVATKFVVPADADVTANMTLNILAAKTGATAGDATKFTVGAYNNVVGALYDADDTFGGDTSAMTGDATAKTVQKVTLTLALANLPVVGSAIELTIKPKDGTLGTDDVIMLAAFVTYKRKLRTS